MFKLVLLPLDERPCNYNFPRLISEGLDNIELVLPPRGVLGEKKRPADFCALREFLRESCRDASGLILSLDMLLYGGIVPSRLHSLPREELEARLELIAELKASNPDLRISAFGLIMRCPTYSSSDEEPDYYAECGREIFLTGELIDRYRAGLVPDGEYRQRLSVLSEKTKGCLKDYLGRRALNLELLISAAGMLGKGIDRLVIPQDDSSPYGYTAMDQVRLRSALAKLGAAPLMYPGADEVGMVLFAEFCNRLAGRCPSVKVTYAAPGAEQIVPLYEDRALFKSVASQIESAGCRQTDRSENADILLFVNAPAGRMVSAGEMPNEGYAARDLHAFVDSIEHAVCEGRRVAVADVAYCNGGDPELAEILERRGLLFRLAAYAGWNTSSNTLGTAIAQAVCGLGQRDDTARESFLALRYFEDLGYCAHVRREVCEVDLPAMGLDYFHADGCEGRAAQIVQRRLTRYMQFRYPKVTERYELAGCRLPWKRMFEVELTVRPR